MLKKDVKVAIMQPYIFPYLGYFQLIKAADKFVVYDDVTFIKQGWINRNYILLNKKKHLFTFPLENSSSNSIIKNVLISARPANWEGKLLATIKQAYLKAPQFENIFPIIRSIFDDILSQSVSLIATKAITEIFEYLNVPFYIEQTSSVYKNAQLKGSDRILDICIKENATQYINAIGGTELYSKDLFSSKGIDLNFIKPVLNEYPQFGNQFIPGLSIIDVLMFNKPDDVAKMLNAYEVV
jgi:hypothetical protein